MASSQSQSTYFLLSSKFSWSRKSSDAKLSGFSRVLMFSSAHCARCAVAHRQLLQSKNNRKINFFRNWISSGSRQLTSGFSGANTVMPFAQLGGNGLKNYLFLAFSCIFWETDLTRESIFRPYVLGQLLKSACNSTTWQHATFQNAIFWLVKMVHWQPGDVGGLRWSTTL
jgi:hypothetical protein